MIMMKMKRMGTIVGITRVRYGPRSFKLTIRVEKMKKGVIWKV